ncbi:SinR family protein [Pyxidicoccus fallax]|uniref:SinR family protein n=1 Tax=Pyxidicoccus fallax TaxID=394095 RepID=A0A848LM32_9BACT|nr:SinR family protein [Pyxidicoccus fallax]NPC79349.1 SinR family protein [Pyxidicoccus fallax]
MFYVTYDLRAPGKNYESLWGRLAALGAKRVLESVWAVSVTGTATDVYNHLVPYIDNNDRLLVVNSADSTWTGRTVLADPRTV